MKKLDKLNADYIVEEEKYLYIINSLFIIIAILIAKIFIYDLLIIF